MNPKTIQRDQAWGLELGGSAVRLVHVVRTASGYHAGTCLEAALDDRWTPGPAALPQTTRLPAQRLRQTLVACIPDIWVLHRALLLPRAEGGELSKLVAAQVEALLPASADQFVWSWDHYPDPFQGDLQRALLCATRKESLEPLAPCGRHLGRQPDLVLPSGLALATAWALLAPPAAESQLLLDVGARSTTLVVLLAGKVFQCAVIDRGGDEWTERLAEELGVPLPQAEALKMEYCTGSAPPSGAGQPVAGCLERALGRWLEHVREAYHGCLSEVPPARRPGQCLLFGRAGQTPALPALAAEALGLEVKPATAPSGLSLGAGVRFERAASAIAAAVCGLQPEPLRASLVRPKAKRLAEARLSRRWAIPLAWLLAAVIALYLLDRHESNWLTRAVQEIQTRTRGQASVEEQMAVSRFLENAAPSPLAVLEEISALAPSQAVLTGWRYGRNGEATLSGTLPGEQDLQAFLKKLSESALVRQLEPGTVRTESGRLRFEVSFKAGAKAVTTRPAEKPSPSTQGPATRPQTAATGPATAPPRRVGPGTYPGGAP